MTGDEFVNNAGAEMVRTFGQQCHFAVVRPTTGGGAADACVALYVDGKRTYDITPALGYARAFAVASALNASYARGRELVAGGVTVQSGAG